MTGDMPGHGRHPPVLRRAGSWPESPVFVELAVRIAEQLSDAIIDTIWAGVDRLAASGFHVVEIDGAPVQIERSISQQLYFALTQVVDRALPLTLYHEPFEFASRTQARARPPQPDIGFVLNEVVSAIWPLETKVLRGDEDVAEYAQEVRDNFVTGRYGGMTAEGALLGYLLSGDIEVAFRNIADDVPCTLSNGASNPPRDHKVSQHHRLFPHGRSLRAHARIHHLLVAVRL